MRENQKGGQPFSHLQNAPGTVLTQIFNINSLINDPVGLLREKFKGANTNNNFFMNNSWANDNLVADILVWDRYELELKGLPIKLKLGGEFPDSNNIPWGQGVGIAPTVVLSSMTRGAQIIYQETEGDYIDQGVLDGAGNYVWVNTQDLHEKVYVSDTATAGGGAIIVDWGATVNPGYPAKRVRMLLRIGNNVIGTYDSPENQYSGRARFELDDWDVMYTTNDMVIEITSHFRFN